MNELFDFKIPSINAPIDEWENFTEKADWQVLWELCQNSMFNPNQHTEKILSLLKQRLLNFEHPILSAEFLMNEADRVVLVDDDADNNTIKNSICGLNFFGKPCYVVKRCGKLIGFAVSNNLILVGVTQWKVRLQAAENCLQQRELNFLTLEESMIVDMVLPELCKMMQKVRVPDFRNVDYWVIQNGFDGEYKIFYRKSVCCMRSLEFSNLTNLVAKI